METILLIATLAITPVQTDKIEAPILEGEKVVRLYKRDNARVNKELTFYVPTNLKLS